MEECGRKKMEVDRFEDVGLEGEIILKRILKEQD